MTYTFSHGNLFIYLQAGEGGDSMYIVESGECDCIHDGVIVDRIRSGEVFGLVRDFVFI